MAVCQTIVSLFAVSHRDGSWDLYWYWSIFMTTSLHFPYSLCQECMSMTQVLLLGRVIHKLNSDLAEL